VTQSFDTPKYDLPANSPFANSNIDRLIDIVKRYPPWRRIIHTRDLDAVMHTTACEAWFVLLTSWSKVEEGAVLTSDATVLEDMLEPYVAEGAQRLHSVQRDVSAAAPSAPRTGRGGALGKKAPLPARPNLPVLLTQLGAQSAFRPTSLDRLPTERRRGDTIVVFLPGVDALPGFGRDQCRRARVSSLLGNDYTGSGIKGISWALVSSGLGESLLSMREEDWSDPQKLESQVSSLVSLLASTAARAKTWRAGGDFGEVAKISSKSTSIGREQILDLIESVRVIRGENVNYVASTFYHNGDPRGPLQFKQAPPSTRPNRYDVDSRQPSHPYLSRPGPQHVVPQGLNQSPTLPTSIVNPRLSNPLQPSRTVPAPGETDPSRPKMSKIRVRPLQMGGSGQSVFMAARTHGPELTPLDDKTIARIIQADASLPVEVNDDDDAVDSELEIVPEDDDDDDDEDDFTAVPKQKGKLNRVESYFATITSPGKNHAAASRKISDITESPRPVSTASASANNAGRSGAQQTATRITRLTSARAPPPEPSRRKDREPVPAPRQTRLAGNPAITEQEAALASPDPMLLIMSLAVKLGNRFVHSAFAFLLELLLEQGEAGMMATRDLLLQRNRAAQCLGRLAAGGAYRAAGEQWFPRQTLVISELEKVRPVIRSESRWTRELTTVSEQEAVNSALASGLVPPPRLSVKAFTIAYAPFQTNLTEWPRTHTRDELVNLGQFVARDLSKNAAEALSKVLRKAHKAFSLDPASEAALQSANIEASARFRAGLGNWLGGVLATAPFSQASAHAGAANEEDKGLPSREKTTSYNLRKGTTGKSGDTLQQQHGLGPKIDPTDPREPPALDLGKETEKSLEQMIKKLVDSVPPGSMFNRSDMHDALLQDITTIAQRLLACRDRHLEMALVLLRYKKIENATTMAFDDVLAGKMPEMGAGTLAKGLLALVMRLRQMRTLSGIELIPVS
jgi:hypothetical protein